jgi:hypothetical protein
MNNSLLRKIEPGVFISGTIVAFLTPIFKEIRIFAIITLILCLFYLLGGWFFLKRENTKIGTVFLFIIGYFFASSYLCVLFATRSYPLGKYLAAFTLISLVILFIVLFIRNKRAGGSGYWKLMIQIVIMAILAAMPFYL